MKLKANGIDTNYVLEGPEGAPVVTFSHSLGSSMALWEAQAALLNDRFRVLRYDNRGHGETEVAPAPIHSNNSPKMRTPCFSHWASRTLISSACRTAA